MPISLSRYVDITSGIGAAENVSTRNLGAMVITGNPLVPTGTLVSFNSASEVLSYFGPNSEEYARALFYFGWVSKNITQANQLSFYNWNDDAATGSLIFGVQQQFTLATFTAITTGDFTLTLGGHTSHLTGLDFSADGSLTAVASTLQTEIRAVSAGGSAWTAATVAYVASPTQGGLPQFTLTSGTTGADVISITAGTVTDVAGDLGWLVGAVLSDGTAAQTITQVLAQAASINNNFGSFCFTYALAPILSTIQAAAAWNNSTNPNIEFMFSVAVIPANASAWETALRTTGGCTLTLMLTLAADALGAFHEMMPMMVMAATDYTQRSAAQNYMFQIFNAVPSITTDSQANIYDALLINYYGQTQTAGQFLSFYQRGVMYGTVTQPSDQNVYVNEVWLKDALGAVIMSLLLSLSQVPASKTGKALLLGVMQPIVNQAVVNGTISAGKILTQVQILYITQATGDNTAWQQVQNAGYWIGAEIVPFVVDSVTEYKAVYTLIYSKDDTVRLVTGSDILI